LERQSYTSIFIFILPSAAVLELLLLALLVPPFGATCAALAYLAAMGAA